MEFFCPLLVLVVVGIRREMSSKRHLFKNPLFLYHPSKNLLYKGKSRYCIEETLVQTSPGGNGMLFLSVYYLLHNRWLAHRQTSPGFPMPAAQLYGKKIHQNYACPIPCCSQEPSAGKTPFSSVPFLCLTHTLPKKDHKDQFGCTLLAPFLCVSLYLFHAYKWGVDTG